MKQLLKKYWLKVVIIVVAFGLSDSYCAHQEGHGKLTYFIHRLIMAVAFILMLGIPFAIEEYKKKNTEIKITKRDLGFMGIAYLISLILIGILLHFGVSLLFMSVTILGYTIITGLNFLIARLNHNNGD